MEGLFGILFVVGIICLAVWAIQAIIRSATHVPTWGGIIISAILGMLPLYLILCFFGVMGEVRNEYLERINHANVVRQAKEMGVSTEGSTLEILERINRKAMEKYLK